MIPDVPSVTLVLAALVVAFAAIGIDLMRHVPDMTSED
jgi:hypothetical protein